jgi:hypothetical protein
MRLFKLLRAPARGSLSRSIALVCATAIVVSATTATAASLITGKDVKNGSLTGTDIKKGSITMNRLSKNTQKSIKAGLTSPQGLPGGVTPGNQGENGGQGPAGQNGAPGANGANGSNGANGANGAASVGPHWGPVARNIIKSPVNDLRNGPFSNTPTGVSSPPFGDGSLGLETGDNTEKAAFGNEVDFTGDSVQDLNQAGFRVFQTGENADIDPANMPNISIEVDPSGLNSTTPPNFTTLAWNPDPAPVENEWTGYLDATSTGKWGLSGSAFNSPATQANCGLNGPRCTLAQAKAALGPNAQILSVSVAKGRDNAWQGAVDGLRINNEVFDFELFGVITRAP